MTTDSLSKIDTSRMSASALARATGLNPHSAQARDLARQHGKAVQQPAQSVSPAAPDWPDQVAAAVATVSGVRRELLCNPRKHDRETMTARRAMVRALRRRLSIDRVAEWLNMHHTTVSKLTSQADVRADTIAERALARVGAT